VSLSDAAERVGVTPATLRRWIRQGLIQQYDGEWTRAAIGQARVVARMREVARRVGLTSSSSGSAK
jgi:adenylate cyclase